NLFGGILFSPESSNVASNKPFMAQSALTVASTTIADIGGVAVLIAPGDIGVVKAALRRVRVFNNLELRIQVLGGATREPIDVAISDSLVTQNGQGIVANTSTAQAPVKVMVTGSTVWPTASSRACRRRTVHPIPASKISSRPRKSGSGSQPCLATPPEWRQAAARCCGASATTTSPATRPTARSPRLFLEGSQ